MREYQSKRRIAGIAAGVVILLLITNSGLMWWNARIIAENRIIEKQTDDVTSTIAQMAIHVIHNPDLATRSYALFGEERYLSPLRIAIQKKDSIFAILEETLPRQGYHVIELNVLRDSVNSYIRENQALIGLIREGRKNEFLSLANRDKGYLLWLQYETLANKINAFEDRLKREATARYTAAEKSNSVIQLLLLVVCIPTLISLLIFTSRSFRFEKSLRQSEAEKAQLLEWQNQQLEKAVEERTREINIQKEAIQKQCEELGLQNNALVESKKLHLDLYTRSLVEKSEIISQLSDEIEALRKNHSHDPQQLKKFNQVLHATILTEQDWNSFKETFESVYPEFFGALRFRLPDITVSELRLAALIKLNMSLKEAAAALGISADSVKKSRYRLKKKIGLSENDSLEEYIRAI